METIKLSANENCYGCSPFVTGAIRRKVREVYLYPEINPVELKKKLAEINRVDMANMIVGAGSVRIIDGLIQTFVHPGEEVLTFERSFSAYGQLCEVHGITCRFAPQTGFRCNPVNLLPLIRPETKLIFIANPNNPTGSMITHGELSDFLEQVPREITVVIDEAYAEYVSDPEYPRSLELLQKHSNLVILHSFSKIYGLAGLRIGYAVMDEERAGLMSRGQLVYSLTVLSSDAAMAALHDRDFVDRSALSNAVQRKYLYHELKNLGFKALPSEANFIYLPFETDTEKRSVYEALLSRGIQVCDLAVFGQDRSLRISVGTPGACKMIIECLGEWSWVTERHH